MTDMKASPIEMARAIVRDLRMFPSGFASVSLWEDGKTFTLTIGSRDIDFNEHGVVMGAGMPMPNPWKIEKIPDHLLTEPPKDEVDLAIWHAQGDWVVAKSGEHARLIVIKEAGYGDEEAPPAEEWRKLPDDKMLKINEREQTAAEWLKELGDKPGLIASQHQ